MQNQLRDFVPLIKFNEINFVEPHRQLLNEKTKRSNGVLSGLTKTKKPADWKERYKHYVSEGLIEPDDDDENYENDKDETSTFRRGNSYDDRLKHFEKTGKFPERLKN